MSTPFEAAIRREIGRQYISRILSNDTKLTLYWSHLMEPTVGLRVMTVLPFPNIKPARLKLKTEAQNAVRENHSV
jgi:hypothetical protein